MNERLPNLRKTERGKKKILDKINALKGECSIMSKDGNLEESTRIGGNHMLDDDRSANNNDVGATRCE